MDKDTIRQNLLQERTGLSAERVSELSEIIQEHLVKSTLWPKSGRIGIYASVKNEVLTHKLFQMALEQGLHVYFPRVEQGLSFYEVNGPEDLQRGAWAIPEPQRHCPMLAEDEKLDLLIVPGLAFTRDCRRIGYGKGFYDRVVGEISMQSLGLAYDFQVLEDFPGDVWDRRLDGVLTEKRLYKITDRM